MSKTNPVLVHDSALPPRTHDRKPTIPTCCAALMAGAAAPPAPITWESTYVDVTGGTLTMMKAQADPYRLDITDVSALAGLFRTVRWGVTGPDGRKVGEGVCDTAEEAQADAEDCARRLLDETAPEPLPLEALHLANFPRVMVEAIAEAAVDELDRRDGDPDHEPEPLESDEDEEPVAAVRLLMPPRLNPLPTIKGVPGAALARIGTALDLYRHPIGPVRTREFLAAAAVILAVEEVLGLPGDPAHHRRIRDLGGIPRRFG